MPEKCVLIRLSGKKILEYRPMQIIDKPIVITIGTSTYTLEKEKVKSFAESLLRLCDEDLSSFNTFAKCEEMIYGD